MVEEGRNIIVHCTITSLGGSPVEPNIDPPERSLKHYHKFCKLLGPERVVLRIDPILSWNYSDEALLDLIDEAEGRVRISFMDLYPHVAQRFARHSVPLDQSSFHHPLEARLRVWETLGQPEVCAEPGLPNTPCVGKADCEILGVEPSPYLKGQRRLCGCLANKVELCTWPPKCTYGCLYCYWKD